MYGAIIIEIGEMHTMKVSALHSNGRYLKDRFNAIKIITGYKWDNTHLYLKNTYGDLYAISFCELKCPHGSPNHEKYSKLFNTNLALKNVVDVHIRTQGGTVSIYNRVFLVDSFLLNVPPKTMIEIKNAVDGYSKDKTLPCSDCGVEMHHKTDEVGGNYFAGICCNKCWDRKWKAVEANPKKL